MCGEKTLSPPFKSNHGGSPPRVRGKALLFCLSNLLPRITPACAGKSSLTSGYIPARGDHPRVCGEKLCPLMGEGEARGSPPRVRGKAIITSFKIHLIGITPACAGKSFISAEKRPSMKDHPRVCGEKWTGVKRGLCALGSPPRVRGKVSSKN